MFFRKLGSRVSERGLIRVTIWLSPKTLNLTPFQSTEGTAIESLL